MKSNRNIGLVYIVYGILLSYTLNRIDWKRTHQFVSKKFNITYIYIL